MEIIMSLLDSAMGAMKGGNNEGGAMSALVSNLLTQFGGVGGLLEKFKAGGLGEVAQSWVSTGQNLPVSPDQINSVLGNERVTELADKLGIDPQQATDKLATYLPQVVDKLTPNGQVPEGSDGNLMGGIGKMFGH
jgi:uncharacterized protein YidB (DUF937 family)